MHYDRSDSSDFPTSEEVVCRTIRQQRAGELRWKRYVRRELQRLRREELFYTSETGGDLIRWTWNDAASVPQLRTGLDVVWLARADGTRMRVKPDAKGWSTEGKQRWLRDYWDR